MAKASSDETREKKSAALTSVTAAIGLTGFKVVVGLSTGSLGILAEAAHSGLDLMAAVMTFLAVRISGKPADRTHRYGHGKVENLSALFETLLLLLTCLWILYEAGPRLLYHAAHLRVTFWSFAVMITSIIVDVSRSRLLYRTARKYNSQALEADARHFSTDIWSSAVVLLGLICANFGYFFADPIAALFVAIIILYATYQLAKRSIEVLLDTAPRSTFDKVEAVIKGIKEITNYQDIKNRK